MTELLVGTRKGLLVLRGEPGAPFAIVTRAFEGEPVDYALRDARTGRVLAAVTSPFWVLGSGSPTTPPATGSPRAAWRCPRAATRR